MDRSKLNRLGNWRSYILETPETDRGTWIERFALPGIFALILPVAVVASRQTVLLLVLAAACVAPAAIRDWRKRRTGLRLPKVMILIALFLAWGALSAVWSIVPGASLTKALQLAVTAIFGIVAVYEVKATQPHTKRRILDACIIGCFAALALIAAKYAWLYAMAGPNVTPDGFNPVSALNPGMTTFAILIWPIAARLAARSSRRLLIAAFAVYVAFLPLLTSGASVLALIAGAMAFCAAMAFPRGAAYAAAALLSAAILAAPFLTPRPTSEPRIVEAAQFLPGSTRHRLYVWEFAADKALARPLLGWGLESSRSVPGGQERPPVGYAYMPLHPHNAALQIWLELGLLGAVLAALVTALLGMAAASAPRVNLCAAATTGTLVSFAMVAFTAYGAWQSWWIAVAWLTAATLVALRADDGAPSAGNRRTHDF